MVSCQPLKLIAGPCVIENPELQFSIAAQMKDITDGLGITCVFQSSFDKASHSSGASFQGQCRPVRTDRADPGGPGPVHWLRAQLLPGTACPWPVPRLRADSPNQVRSWDIPYLPTTERGVSSFLNAGVAGQPHQDQPSVHGAAEAGDHQPLPAGGIHLQCRRISAGLALHQPGATGS